MPEGDPFLELVLDESNSIRWHYDLVHLVFEKEGAEAAVNLIPIGRVGDRLIVAASKDSWSRTVAERILPRNSLQKPLLIEVGLALHSEPETLLPEETTRLWLGLLEKKSEKELVPGRDLDALADPWFDDITDGQLRIPFAEALVDAAESQYAFQSAPEDPPLEQRMSVLEDSLRQIQIGLQKVIEPWEASSHSDQSRCSSGDGQVFGTSNQARRRRPEDSRFRSSCGHLGFVGRYSRGAVEKASRDSWKDFKDARYPPNPRSSQAECPWRDRRRRRWPRGERCRGRRGGESRGGAGRSTYREGSAATYQVGRADRETQGSEIWRLC